MMLEPATDKSLQLNPVWEQVLRNRRVPPGVGVEEVFREIRGRLYDDEWEVRQHALRVLADVLQVVSPLSEHRDLQTAIVINLGSPAPGVRRAARDTLIQLLQNVKNPEDILIDLVERYREDNIVLGIIISLPDLLKPFILPKNGGYVLASGPLITILTFLISKVPVPIFQKGSIDSFLKIREMCGEIQFQRCLSEISPERKIIQLLSENVDDEEIGRKSTQNLKNDANWSDYSDESEAIPKKISSFELRKNQSSEEDISDGSDETFTMESLPDGGRVVMETEIKLSEEKAITMRIMEDASVEDNDGCDGRFVSADGALIMSVVSSSDEDAGRRTPRRVRFGGEEVKLCTPDSDATDVRIEIQETNDKKQEKFVSNDKPSQIPLPVSPATTIPHPPLSSPNKSREISNSSKLPSEPSFPVPEIEIVRSETPTLTGSSISEKLIESHFNSKQNEETYKEENHQINSAYAEMSPNHTDILSLMGLNSGLESSNDQRNPGNDKDTFEKFTRSLSTAETREKLKSTHPEVLKKLFCYLLENSTAETLHSTVSQILEVLPQSSCQALVQELVPELCKHAGASTSAASKIAVAGLLKTLFSHEPPSTVLNVLLGEKCLRSSSSKMRENSLTTLLHILMAFPSLKLPPHPMLEEVCSRVADNRRRVRQAALETLAVIAQIIPNKDIIECASKVSHENPRMLSAISCRLARKTLPSVSPDGLVLYALQIPSSRRMGHIGPPEGADVDWILAGTGSLSTGSARFRSQLPLTLGPAGFAGKHNPWTAQKQRNEESILPYIEAKDDENGWVESDNGINTLRPFYVRFAGSEEAFRSQHYALHRVADPGAVQASIRILTPSVLRKNRESRPSPWTEARNRNTDNVELMRVERVTGRKLTDPERPMMVTYSPNRLHNSTPPSALFLPSIESPEKYHPPSRGHSPRKTSSISSTSMEKPRFVETVLPTETLTTCHGLSHSLPAVSRMSQSEVVPKNPGIDTLDEIHGDVIGNEEEKLFQAAEKEISERVTTVSAPPAIATNANLRESSSSSSSSETIISLDAIPAKNQGLLEPSGVHCQNLNDSYNQKVKTKQKLLSKNGNGKVAPTGPRFPDSLKSFDRPKDGLDTCFNQLDAQQWEVTLQGLTTLIRLVRHHQVLVNSNIHALTASLARHIRNLRSQVSRAACAVAAEMFSTLKRTLEPELEELAGALFHRVADTNKFIRQDTNAALDAMVDNIAPQKSIPVILSRGLGHHNAIVRTAVARLFLRITERMGPEKIMSLPKDTRDKMLQAGAGLLTEGRLETRTYTKQLFRIWSAHGEFSAIIQEAIPPNIMRQISKTLTALRA